MAITFAKRMDLLKASEIREILKITEREGMISFAGGLPAPELFPVEELKQVTNIVLNEAGSQALQYSTTEGFEPLRRQIAERMNRKFKTNVHQDNILITSGSQQALDFSGKLFLNAGDIILCESPTYLAALSAFRAYQPKFIEIPTDDEGMKIDALEKALSTNTQVKLVYIIPDFQNPTGRTWSMARRKQFIRVMKNYDIPVIEDNPYGELRFEGEILPSVKSLDTTDQVIFVSTFSKTFCPGMRIGWIAAEVNLIKKYVLIKQGADLHTSSISQREISKFIELYDFDAHIDKIISVYRRRRDVMLQTMREEFHDDIKFTHPQGGLFLWVELPQHIKAVDLLTRCLERSVAFVPGDSFFPNNRVENTLRLNYSNMPEEKIREGIKRLAKTIREYQ